MSHQPSPTPAEPGRDAASAQSRVDGVGVPGGDGGRPRLAPRPLDRPVVDPLQAQLFARPAGVAGPFARPHDESQAAAPLRLAPPPPESLATAFGRPTDQPDVLLQRPPGASATGPAQDAEAALWSEHDQADPWRNPAAGAVLGPPALGEKTTEEAPEQGLVGRQFSVPELLFGRRVKPSGLVLFLVAALAVGAVGGLVGWGIARAGNPLTDAEVTLAQVAPGKERPVGSVAEIADRVTPSVVSIEVVGAQTAQSGSGVVIDGNGYILTNNHVVSAVDADQTVKITSVFTDGTRAESRVVGRDPKTDLAVIKVEVTNPTVIQLGDANNLKVGDTVIAVGSPLTLANTVTEGIVSALHRPVTAAGEGGGEQVTYDAIQTDAAINPGNSGGALVDSTGALVGINSSIVSETGNSVGLGFAIPVNDARRIAQALIQGGQVKHADLGVNARSVSAETAAGAQVQNVQEGGAGARAGIAEGDVIIKVGDRQVRDAAELIVAVRSHQPGEKVPVVLVRDGRQMEIPVTLGSD
ncbi:S1C family serine protease [Goodfellowiella coeruleoviolacea]|uniref:Serine protease, S1-C subfamily, contains C-terminal PDZ domain n=1 Tax=Goodfellowiella coeruleoviolacea TaxID=334858 RepID=A0AAE3GG92_9PSEU|nr:trypsin-like peptidase domain-containing protein [Goodfellowiella coeruleoviolacea]MCP2165583.1 serine protease, S1-C subfamily, contains C-terminal PDZ domain [Goodfellowiella coeruleoviolacea]